mgnify:CR=1 FL=1
MVLSIVILHLTAITWVQAMSTSKMCRTSGFTGCECLFVGGCNWGGNPLFDSAKNPNFDGFAPTEIEQFAYEITPGVKNLGRVCEGETVAILYDCDARIPLYSATMIEGNQAKEKVDRSKASFHASTDPFLGVEFQQSDKDYMGSSKHKFCYKDQSTDTDLNWDGKACTSSPGPIDRGHMIPAGYARGDAKRVHNTFAYTNMVPQFSVFNRGEWRRAEDSELVKTWGDECHKAAGMKKLEARIYVIVGAVPTTYTTNSRFFGRAGFSNFGSDEYRIVVPHIMWTAACCILEDNTVFSVTAFSRENLPGKDKVEFYNSPQDMVKALFPVLKMPVDLFPHQTRCMTG